MVKRIDKPWGYEIIWAQTESYVGKILHINPRSALSRQYHKEKDETFYVQSGYIHLELGERPNIRTIYLTEGESFHCPPGTVHRMMSPAGADVIEVSTTQLDDIVRLEDDYDRC